MSKIFIICSLLIVSAFSTASFAQQDDRHPGRPGDNRPGRPGDNGPGRPGDNGPGRPGDQRPPTGRVVFTNTVDLKVQKIIETTNTIRVNQPNVKVVKFTALNNSVEIVEARLLLDNGREVYMDGVTGGLGKNRNVTYTLNGPRGERLQSITVRAVSRSLLGTRPSLQVAVGVLQ